MTKQMIKVLIADDEPIARDILESYLQKMTGFSVVSKCKNALEALNVLNKEQVNLMLLDINMPEISGMDFLRTLKDPPHVIFTTAYSEFAVQSYELNAIDYLLKPISFERFLKAANKISTLIKTGTEPANSIPSGVVSERLMFVRSDGKWIKIDINKLWFVEGLKDYVRLWTDEGKITVHSTMKNFEEQLSAYTNFVRVHKSHIVNMEFINEMDGNYVKVKGQLISIGNTYREEISKLFNSYKFM